MGFLSKHADASGVEMDRERNCKRVRPAQSESVNISGREWKKGERGKVLIDEQYVQRSGKASSPPKRLGWRWRALFCGRKFVFCIKKNDAECLFCAIFFLQIYGNNLQKTPEGN